jgi:hypothetical protein
MRETTTVDYKERLNWNAGRFAQIEVLRDLAGFANREGGTIVVGLREVGGSIEATGLQTDDPIPDATVVGQLFREHFDPPAEINTGTAEVDGITFGWLSVGAFSVSPIIATRDIHDERTRRPALTDGDLLIRSDALAIEKVKARDLRALLDRAITNRGRAFAAHLPPREAVPLDPTWGPASPRTRLLELQPVPSPQAPLRLREIEAAARAARVTSRHGNSFMPAEVDFESLGRTLREPGRIIGQSRESDPGNPALTTAMIDDRLGVRIREAPWETANGSDTSLKVDVTSVVVFVATATRFAVNLYASRSIDAMRYRVGIATPAGARLSVNPAAFWSLNSPYVATSRSDIWVERDAALPTLGTFEERQAFNST